MFLEIENFAKIKNAKLKLQGITVITGNNNTGKTTVGKILFSVFNALYDLTNLVEKKRNLKIENICVRALSNFMLESFGKIRLTSHRIVRQIIDIDPEKLDELSLRHIILQVVPEISSEDIDLFIEYSLDEIIRIKELDDYKIARELITSYFSKIFNGQIQSLRNNSEARVELTIKNRKINLDFKNNECIKWEREIDIMHEAFFVDNPFFIDELDGTSRHYTDDLLRKKLFNRLPQSHDLDEDFVLDSIIAKEKLGEIYSILNKIVPGNIGFKDGRWALDLQDYGNPVFFRNLSTGLKSFVILKMLLENGTMKYDDVLILDEPEIHLHPEWQIKYAEVIVLLQRAFNLNILVTTHSRDFFEAITLYSKKYEVEDKCNYYISKFSDGEVEFEDVKDDISKVYGHFINPCMLLDELRFELEDEDKE